MCAETRNTAARRRRRRASIEANRIAQHEVILRQDKQERKKTTASQVLMIGESGESGEDGEGGEGGESGEDGDAGVFVVDDDGGWEIIGARDTQGRQQRGLEDRLPSIIPVDKGQGRALSVSSDGFRDIDELLADCEPKSRPPPQLISLSQVKSESQLPSQMQLPTSLAATGTRGARGVERKKTNAQLEKESQERHEVEDKEQLRIQAA
ncbi:hypothetical protein N7G274_002968 [Stereocaulon virgatum]|uniref:Uncharacterized protein n=1 Tax=Stereocaulon virgatum TaxID=373712 RepID=A0ABR4AES2_9LECA